MKMITTRETASASVRVLRMLNQWFRQSWIAPSYREIGYFASVSASRVRGYLDQLQDMGHLFHQAGIERSIKMTDLCANIPDNVMLRGCHGRGWVVTLPPNYPLTTNVPS